MIDPCVRGFTLLLIRNTDRGVNKFIAYKPSSHTCMSLNWSISCEKHPILKWPLLKPRPQIPREFQDGEQQRGVRGVVGLSTR